MSIAIMTLAFRASVTCTQKMVLLALADSANDQGECYPSVQNLMPKCSLSDRAVQKAVSELEALGHLHRDFRKGRSTVYWIHPIAATPEPGSPHPRTTFTPERRSPPNDVHPTPEPRSPTPPNDVHPTPEPRSPITINEPSVEPSGNQKQKRVPALKVEVDPDQLIAAGFDAKTADEFMAHKRGRKAPLTERAWRDHIREAEAAGWTPLAAAEKVMARNWSGFEAKYVANERRPQQLVTDAERRAQREAKTARAKALVFGARTQETFDV